MIHIISVRENPEYKDQIISYIQKSWSDIMPEIYKDCIDHCVDSSSPLPQWYILMKDSVIIGCAGLITNDFISRMDLYPWLAALFIDQKHRGNSYASLLIDKVKADTKNLGFNNLYLCTDHVSYYEKHDFVYIGNGYHPWGENSRIYKTQL